MLELPAPRGLSDHGGLRVRQDRAALQDRKAQWALPDPGVPQDHVALPVLQDLKVLPAQPMSFTPAGGL
ncbi:hypothetical protein GCM10023143_23350 [Compostibacter hankyongensis]|uniref:Uncharacterized protein n=1 Tax=Compostibacter hankyongensis TaxID=1007089 RepID=A0ABP8FXT8_9BACT